MSVVVITPPEPLVTVPDAKSWAPVLVGEDDVRVAALIAAAHAALEPPNNWLGCALGIQTLEARFDRLCGGRLPLRFPPLRSVISVAYRDPAEAEQVLSTDAYDVIGLDVVGACAAITTRPNASWPAVSSRRESVRVRFTAGFEADDPTLSPARHAIVLGAVHLRSIGTRDLALSSRNIEGVGSRNWVVSDAAAALVRNTVESLLMPMRVWA